MATGFSRPTTAANDEPPTFHQSTPKNTPRKYEFVGETPNSRWLFKLSKDIDLTKCSPPRSMQNFSPLLLSPESPIRMPASPVVPASKNKYLEQPMDSVDDSLWWQNASSSMLSFLANEQLCATMLEDEEPPPISAEILDQSMEWTKDLEMETGGDRIQPMQSMNDILASVTQTQFNDTVEAMDFYIEKGKQFGRTNY